MLRYKFVLKFLLNLLLKYLRGRFVKIESVNKNILVKKMKVMWVNRDKRFLIWNGWVVMYI